MHKPRKIQSKIPWCLTVGASLFVGAAYASPTVSGGTISWPDDGWYQVQDATTYQSLCEGGSSCDVSPGTYVVINHSTGERFNGIVVEDSTPPTTPPPPSSTEVSVTGNTISWPDDGWYQVQDATTYESVCGGGTSCEVNPGTYVVINHSTGQRFTGIVVSDSSPPTTPPTSNEVIVTGNTISWPDDGWYQVQDATTYQTMCEGGRSCEVPSGTYTVINHSTGDRTRISVDDETPPTSGSTVEVNFEIEVPFYSSNALQVQILWGATDLTAAWVIDESWSVTGTLPRDTEHPLSIIFSDDNGDTTLASFDSSFQTGSTAGETYRVNADQFDSERWDSDSDGISNLAELRAGTDPYVVDTTSPTGPTAPLALNITTYSGYDVELFWPRATDDVVVMGYDIYRNGEQLASLLDALSYYDPTTEPESEYLYTVYAVDNDGFRSTPVSATVLTPADQPSSGIPTQFANLTGGNGSAIWYISDGLTTTNGSPNGGSCTTRDGAGSGVGVQDATLNSDEYSQGDAFDNASMLWINGHQVGGYMRSANGSTSNNATVPISGLHVTAQYHAVSSMATLRHYTTLRNDTDSDIYALVNLSNNFGSDNGTNIVSTSNDDTTLATNARWVITNDSASPGYIGDPANTTVFYGPGSPRSTVAFIQQHTFDCASTDGLLARLDVIVPAGSQRSLLFFHHLSINDVNAVIEAGQFDTTPELGDPLVEGLTQEQLSEVVNWDF